MDIAEDVKGLPNPPKGWMWQLVPDYPAGDVVAACICGSWPGGPCLKCPPTKEAADHAIASAIRSGETGK